MIATMTRAIGELHREGALVQAVSSPYRTAPRDVVEQPEFINAAARLEFDGEPPGLLSVLKAIERRLGRQSEGRRWGPRPIDLDILVWEGGAWRDGALRVPHERLHERRFALVPLLEIDPDLALPDGTPLRALDDALAGDPDQSVERLTGVSLR